MQQQTLQFSPAITRFSHFIICGMTPRPGAQAKCQICLLLHIISDDATIDRQISQAANAGITGFISSWWGMNDKTDTNFAKLLTRSAAYANTTGHHVTSAVYIENTSTK